MNLFARLWQKSNATKAREALGVDDVAYDAVAEALATTEDEQEPVLPFVPLRALNYATAPTIIDKLEQSHTSSTKPEYHMSLAAEMVASLEKNEVRLLNEIDDVKRIYREKLTDLESELADVRKTAAFYRTAPDHLGEHTAAEIEKATERAREIVRKSPTNRRKRPAPAKALMGHSPTPGQGVPVPPTDDTKG